MGTNPSILQKRTDKSTIFDSIDSIATIPVASMLPRVTRLFLIVVVVVVNLVHSRISTLLLLSLYPSIHPSIHPIYHYVVIGCYIAFVVVLDCS
jgi:hypothetical protein